MAILDRLLRCTGFDWDDANSHKIWEKHQVAPMECEQVFFNQPLVAGHDSAHSQSEERFYALGQTDAGRYLFVVVTVRGELLRVVPARPMSRRERKVYESA
jgi:uncharacterized DUF497 family protein